MTDPVVLSFQRDNLNKIKKIYHILGQQVYKKMVSKNRGKVGNGQNHLGQKSFLVLKTKNHKSNCTYPYQDFFSILLFYNSFYQLR